MTALQTIRTILFYLLLSLSVTFWATLSALIAPLLPYRLRYKIVVQTWCQLAVWLAKVVAGVNYCIEGLEHIPKQPCVILSKHQSTWETLFLSGLFEPLTQVLKRELLWIPFFGWAMYLLKPIAIDRSKPKTALKQVAKQGLERLKQGNWLLIFPEGTRVPPEQIGKFSRGGAALAVEAHLPVLPIAHNAGEFWPKKGWAKHPGTIRVIIGPPLYAQGNDAKAISELNERAFAWVRAAQAQISGQEPSLYSPAPRV